ncbi:uncharacterized protein TNCV_4923561 [Trichonephila clavipes]|nr:uncharacterized protein TNCV_4923561 [Trichonephila clavipes]
MLVTLTSVSLGLGSNPAKGMDVCKCIVHSRHGGTLTSRRAAIPLVKLMEEEEKGEAFAHLQSILPQNWGEIEPKRTVT